MVANKPTHGPCMFQMATGAFCWTHEPNVFEGYQIMPVALKASFCLKSVSSQ